MLSSSVAHRFAWRMRLSVNKFGDYSLLVLLKKRGKGVATRLKFKFKILALLLKTRSTKTTAT